jgi:hypothetical protein
LGTASSTVPRGCPSPGPADRTPVTDLRADGLDRLVDDRCAIGSGRRTFDTDALAAAFPMAAADLSAPHHGDC